MDNVKNEWVRRFNEKWAADESGCWIWSGARTKKGYGQIKIPKTRRQEYAHRLSWMIHNGAIPEGRHVLHRCDNPTCVNPDHLFLGDPEKNAQDMREKGRHLYGERNTEAVLTSPDVRKIKSLLAVGGFSQAEIGRMFGVCQMTISRIGSGKRWAHIK